MFTTTFLQTEGAYRREQLRRAWGGPVLPRLRRHRRAAATRPRPSALGAAPAPCTEAVVGAR
ncbi:hypothetical protein [uncultured Serinicoccus sp.]|uniref:hypothetical protein n=1 Tax=uncultured Serinicoccus sp. TaxID=735514 RepID=UPI00260BABD8|nr:hypothetical protein [uncultured Serinicoccus sp.]